MFQLVSQSSKSIFLRKARNEEMSKGIFFSLAGTLHEYIFYLIKAKKFKLKANCEKLDDKCFKKFQHRLLSLASIYFISF